MDQKAVISSGYVYYSLSQSVLGSQFHS